MHEAREQFLSTKNLYEMHGGFRRQWRSSLIMSLIFVPLPWTESFVRDEQRSQICATCLATFKCLIMHSATGIVFRTNGSNACLATVSSQTILCGQPERQATRTPVFLTWEIFACWWQNTWCVTSATLIPLFANSPVSTWAPGYKLVWIAIRVPVINTTGTASP